ncbi:biotin-dependent carboxyltransferase family protein [Streptomyces inhibens]|uniref:biotin-dependent carboxyltransferase family protein n=1 Tax=Streptomyces inhibens TaxID=2293571 RepID=UPI0037BDF675
MNGRSLEILSPGPLTTVQDLGRPGWSHIGVPPSGAADPSSLALANRLLGNPENAAALEITYGGLRARLRSRRPDGTRSVLYTALTGAPCPARLDDRPIAMNAPVPVLDGQCLELGVPTAGLRTYLAVRGGLDVPVTLGSRSTDVLSKLGPPPLTTGDVVQVAPPVGRMPGVDLAPCTAPPHRLPRRCRQARSGVEALYGAADQSAAAQPRQVTGQTGARDAGIRRVRARCGAGYSRTPGLLPSAC